MIHPGQKWFKQVSPYEETDEEMKDRLKKAGIITSKKAKTNENSWGDGSFRDWEGAWEEIEENDVRTHRSSSASSSGFFGFTRYEQEKMWGKKDKHKSPRQPSDPPPHRRMKKE